jgi:hypothetical protein
MFYPRLKRVFAKNNGKYSNRKVVPNIAVDYKFNEIIRATLFGKKPGK